MIQVDDAWKTSEIRSFGLKQEFVDSRLSYMAFNPLAA